VRVHDPERPRRFEAGEGQRRADIWVERRSVEAGIERPMRQHVGGVQRVGPRIHDEAGEERCERERAEVNQPHDERQEDDREHWRERKGARPGRAPLRRDGSHVLCSMSNDRRISPFSTSMRRPRKRRRLARTISRVDEVDDGRDVGRSLSPSRRKARRPSVHRNSALRWQRRPTLRKLKYCGISIAMLELQQIGKRYAVATGRPSASLASPPGSLHATRDSRFQLLRGSRRRRPRRLRAHDAAAMTRPASRSHSLALRRC